jgi:hypothetical protein
MFFATGIRTGLNVTGLAAHRNCFTDERKDPNQYTVDQEGKEWG